MLRVLLIDDQSLTERLVRQMVTGGEAAEFMLDYIQDPLLAEAWIQENLPDVILLDYTMPGLDGFELLERLRGVPSTQSVPILILSANEDAVQKAQAFALGANDYLVKLPDEAELLARLRYYANAHRAHLRQQAAEKALQDREARLQAILDNALDAIITMDCESQIVDVNPAAIQLLGYSREAMLGQPMTRFILSEPFWQLHGQVMRDGLRGEALTCALSKKWEVDGLRENGQQIDLEMAMIATVPSGEEAIHFTAFLQDVTAQKQLLKSLEETLSVAEMANRIKSNFLSTMSHEIRTPMNAVMGLTELALGSEVSPKVHDYLTKIQGASHSLLRIINDILDFSKMDAGRLKLESLPFRISDLLDHVSTLLRAQAEEKGVAWVVEMAPDCGGILQGDPFRLEQVLTNLVSNAIKFTEKGRVTCRVGLMEPEAEAESQPVVPSSQWFAFSVEDTGIGLTEEQRQGLFHPFMQADSSTTRRYGGTGLGLSICKRIADSMGGTLHVESVPGEGSLFCFAVPLLRAEAEEDRVMHASGEKGAGQAESGQCGADALLQAVETDCTTLSGAHLLLVEDMPINQQVARELLEKVGIRVDLAQDGATAVEMAVACDYDAILMDIQMPDMDGYEATRLIRRDPRWAERPIIAMTAHVLFDDQAHCLAAGMNDHIAKPIDKHKLYDVLTRWVIRGERSQIQAPPPEPVRAEGDRHAMPESLPGIDLADGLNRTGGNHRLYRSLLQEFVRDFAETPVEVRSLLLEGRRQNDAFLAGQRVHAIRGMAGNLSAHPLFQATQQLERAIREERRADWPELLDRFEQALRQVVEGIQTGLVESTRREAGTRGSKCPLDLALVTPFLTLLAKLVDEGNVEVFACLDHLKPHLQGGGLDHEMQQLEACLEQFHFEGAWVFLTAIAQRLEISLEWSA